MFKKINLKGKTAMVTGAGKGIGKACAIALAEAGAKVVIISRTLSDLTKVEKEIKKTKQRLNEIYSKHTGKKIEDIQEVMERDRYFSPNEAVEFGLIDKIVESRKT